MPLRLKELATLVGGTITGNGDLTITGAATLRDSQPGHITFADDERFVADLDNCRAAAVVVPAGVQPTGLALITVSDVREAFATIVSAFCPPRSNHPPGISPQATVSPTAKIASGATIRSGCVIGDDVTIGFGTVVHPNVTIMAGSTVGEETTIFPGAVLYSDTTVGDRVIIHAAAVLGAYGFGYELVDGQHRRCPQLGSVTIEDDVEIGAGTTIDRGSYGPTIIRSGTKIDNQVMIGHNCIIGRNNLLCAHVGVAGSCTTGDNVVLGGQVGLRDHIDICDNVMIGAQSGVSGSLTEPGKYLGSPAIPLRQEIQLIMARQRLPELRKLVKQLERAVQDHGDKDESDAAIDAA